MYLITTSASGLWTYRSEPGSSSAARHSPACLSQKSDEHKCSERNAAMRAAA